MDLEFIPNFSIQQGRLNVIIAPADILVANFNENLNYQRFLTLYVCGNYSRVLNRLDTSLSHFDIRRAFTSNQLLTVLQESCHTIVILEHDPTLYDGDKEMRGFISHALRELSHTNIVILYAPMTDQSLAGLLRGVSRLFLYEGSEEFLQDRGFVKRNDRWRSRIGFQEILNCT
jgi:DNA polymerase I